MNPYEVLGVSENADEETIKKAYKELVKKYHPDRYINNPLAKEATKDNINILKGKKESLEYKIKTETDEAKAIAEKMKEINKAYDMITNKRTATNTGYSTSSRGYSTSQTHTSGQASFQNVRILITQSRIREALEMLNLLPKTAEWYYLSGLARMQVGWYDQAISFLQTAVQMEPNNVEYRSTLNNVMNRNRTYTSTTSTGSDSAGCCDCSDCCNCCTTWLCCNCMC